MTIRQHRRRLDRLAQRHRPSNETPTLAATLASGEQIGFLNGKWVPWDQALPPACKVYGFDPRPVTERQP